MMIKKLSSFKAVRACKMAIFGIVLSSLLPVRAIQPGDPGVYQFGGSLYKVVSGPTWYDAEANAEALGGYLASITTPEEDVFLYNNIVLVQPQGHLEKSHFQAPSGQRRSVQTMSLIRYTLEEWGFFEAPSSKLRSFPMDWFE